jgi:hypothetical protein
MAAVKIGNLLPPARLIQCYSKVICERSLQHPESDFLVFERLGTTQCRIASLMEEAMATWALNTETRQVLGARQVASGALRP